MPADQLQLQHRAYLLQVQNDTKSVSDIDVEGFRLLEIGNCNRRASKTYQGVK